MAVAIAAASTPWGMRTSYRQPKCGAGLAGREQRVLGLRRILQPAGVDPRMGAYERGGVRLPSR
jgi:hypothetical protein